MRDRVPWVRVPAWVDPARPWLRNTTRDQQTVDTRVHQLTDHPDTDTDAAADAA